MTIIIKIRVSNKREQTIAIKQKVGLKIKYIGRNKPKDEAAEKEVHHPQSKVCKYHALGNCHFGKSDESHW